jgi:hypothetical protein
MSEEGESGSSMSESRFKKLKRLWRRSNDSKKWAIQVMFWVVESPTESPLNRPPESPLNLDV